MLKVSNLEGHVFGCLLVRVDLGQIYNENKTYKARAVLAECLNCSNGFKRYYFDNLKAGKIKSCGCLKSENISKKVTLHGKTNTPIYRIWSSMKKRCLNPNDKGYKNYGGRGISVCDRWVQSFENFLADVGEPPPNCDLDRTNNEKGYSPENCKWVSRSENAFNRRRSPKNKSGKTGVCWNKLHKKWQATIRKNGQVHHLGLFKSIEDAIQARKKSELELFGYTKD